MLPTLPRARILIILLLSASFAACGGGAEEEVRTVRGVFMGPRYENRAALIDHEAIPGVMPAMEMGFKVKDSAEMAGLLVGDKIAFDYVAQGGDYWIRNLRLLPDTTTLVLAE